MRKARMWYSMVESMDGAFVMPLMINILTLVDSIDFLCVIKKFCLLINYRCDMALVSWHYRQDNNGWIWKTFVKEAREITK